MQHVDVILEGVVVPVNEGMDVFKEGMVAIKDGFIVDVGESAAKRNEYSATKVFSLKNKIIMPGLVNAHTHVAMTYIRCMADDMNLYDWLKKIIWPVEPFLTPEVVFAGAALGCLEMLMTGTTAFADQYFYVDETAKAVEEIGLRARLAPGTMDFGDPEKTKRALAENERLLKEYSEKGRISIMLGPHAPYSCSRDLLEGCQALSEQYDAMLHTHISESRDEFCEIRQKHGLTPIEYLDSIGFLSEKVLAAHCVWLSDNDIEILDRRKVKIAHNPVSNMKLAAGISPLERLLNRVQIGIGTDSASSNNCLDLFREMKAAALIHKVNTMDPTFLNAAQIVRLSTIESAYAIGLGESIGSLEVGKEADIIVVNTDSPHFVPFFPECPDNVYSHLVYSATGRDVETVFVGGNLIMHNNKILMADPEEIRERAQREARSILRRAKVI